MTFDTERGERMHRGRLHGQYGMKRSNITSTLGQKFSRGRNVDSAYVFHLWVMTLPRKSAKVC
jgi:hypothetical protein